MGRSRLDDAIIPGSLGECTLRLGHPHEALAHLAAAAQRTVWDQHFRDGAA